MVFFVESIELFVEHVRNVSNSLYESNDVYVLDESQKRKERKRNGQKHQ